MPFRHQKDHVLFDAITPAFMLGATNNIFSALAMMFLDVELG